MKQNINMAILCNDNHIINRLKDDFKTIDVFDNYMKLTISSQIKKYALIIFDSMIMPFFNEPKLIGAINQQNRETRIICILRDSDIEFLRRIHDSNHVCYVLEYPVNFTHLNDIINNILESRNLCITK